ncbi:hypothetical protein [Algoriphagus yeomjeoni]|nr:hypothetical protein [Algoriphagus yeomjeoni]
MGKRSIGTHGKDEYTNRPYGTRISFGSELAINVPFYGTIT